MIESLHSPDGHIYAYISWQKLDINANYSPRMKEEELALCYVDSIFISNTISHNRPRKIKELLMIMAERIAHNHPHLTHCYWDRTKDGELTHGVKIHDRKSLFKLLSKRTKEDNIG